MDPLLIVLGGVAVLGGIAWVGHVQRTRRTQALAARAELMGWSFEAAPGVPPALTEMEPLREGLAHRARNRLTRRTEGREVSAFDLQYTVSAGKTQVQRHQTLAHAPLAGRLPVFSLRPEHLGHRVAGALGMQDIDFAEHPAFSRGWLLRGPDEPAIRAVFTPRVIAFCQAHPGVVVVCTGRDLYLWPPYRLLSADEMVAHLDLADELRGLLGG